MHDVFPVASISEILFVFILQKHNSFNEKNPNLPVAKMMGKT